MRSVAPAQPGRDHLGYRVAGSARAKWITVCEPSANSGLARWATVPQARRSRRSALATGATAALLLAGPGTLTGCGTWASVPEGPDPLEAPARRAAADAALAAAVAKAHATLAATANALAGDRAAHASTLRSELHRVHPDPVPGGAAQPASPVGAPAVSADPAAAQAALTQAMHAAQDEAVELVITLPGYRAALLASIAACCATHTALLT